MSRLIAISHRRKWKRLERFPRTSSQIADTCFCSRYNRWCLAPTTIQLLRAFERKFGYEGTASLLRALTYFDEAEATPDPLLLDQRLSWERTREHLKKAVRDFASS